MKSKGMEKPRMAVALRESRNPLSASPHPPPAGSSAAANGGASGARRASGSGAVVVCAALTGEDGSGALGADWRLAVGTVLEGEGVGFFWP